MLHAEALADAAAAPFLALPSFQFVFHRRAGGCPPRGLRGVLRSLGGRSHAAFGVDHLRSRKFMAAGVCASFPGTDADGVFHLGVRPSADGASVTLTLADYTRRADDAPVHPGFALRWAEPGGAAHADHGGTGLPGRAPGDQNDGSTYSGAGTARRECP